MVSAERDTKAPNHAGTQFLLTRHQDFLQHIAFDHYGRRLATCSGDRNVMVWQLENGEWTSPQEGSWKAHLSSVNSLSWAHPEFGQLLATCGTDGFVKVWEERSDSSGGGFTATLDSTENGTTLGKNMNRDGTASRWAARVSRNAGNKPLTCVKFAPGHLGLKFATGCVNGIVYIYEAINRMELTDWIKSHEIEFEKSSSFSEVGVTCLDWCPGRSEPPTLVIGGRSGNLEIYRCSDASSTYTHFIKLDSRNASPTPQPSMVQGILDVSWSPDVGRSFHLIASCGRDGELRVYRLKKKPAKDESGSDSPSMNTLELEPSQKLDTHGCTMWRCGWNVTGTVLASSGDGGNVLLHKSDWQNVWKLVSRVDQGMGP